jgi:hypothetical protein
MGQRLKLSSQSHDPPDASPGLKCRQSHFQGISPLDWSTLSIRRSQPRAFSCRLRSWSDHAAKTAIYDCNRTVRAFGTKGHRIARVPDDIRWLNLHQFRLFAVMNTNFKAVLSCTDRYAARDSNQYRKHRYRAFPLQSTICTIRVLKWTGALGLL